jgi:catechol 2,3-dioxygenase-like lactoylglutathione lyase family enzyme
VTAPLIEHIGFLVPDLEEAIERWSALTGYTFSPIARYRTQTYADHSDAEPHFHDARISFSAEGPPRIELMEVTGEGTHGASEVGIHHFGFPGTASPEDRLAELAALGVGHDGVSYDADGRVLLCFTDKAALDGVRLEYISPLPGPTVADDGSALWKDPETGRNSLWGPPRP